MTLVEIMEGVTPGSIKVTRGSWEDKDWFKPYYLTFDFRWRGMDNLTGDVTEYDDNYWEIWEEPVEMEDRWKFVCLADGKETRFFYKSEADLIDHNHDNSTKEFKRLDYTKTQFLKDKFNTRVSYRGFGE